MQDFPHDLIEEILCLVPATSLKPLRSTCKSWNRLYKDKRFVRKHFDKAAKQFLPLILTKDFKICWLNVDLQGTPSVEIQRDSNSAQTKYIVKQVFHCDGLLLCTTEDKYAIVVWNPLTRETSRIDTGKRISADQRFVLGYYYYQDNTSCNKSYKILSFHYYNNDSEIYEFKSGLWKTIDDFKPSLSLAATGRGVSLKGDSYWFASNSTNVSMTLLRFDFTTEKSEGVPLPCPIHFGETRGLSVVREEKLSMLLKREIELKTGVWVTNKIDETKVVSWSKVLALDLSPDLQISSLGSFLLDEEKKIIVCCNRKMVLQADESYKDNDMVYIVGEDSEVTKVDFGEAKMGSCWSYIFNYVPSLVQIRSNGGKRKRGV